MNRKSKVCSPPLAALIGLSLAACSPATLPDVTRRSPDGVAIDPISAPPAARDQAQVADGLVTLRTPLGIDRALVMVQELFRAVVVEDGDAVKQLLDKDARAITGASGGGSGQTHKVEDFWQNRFRKLDYTKLAGDLIYRDTELTIYRAEDALDTPPHPAIHLDALRGNDVIIRVPILTTRIGADRLFGDEIVLWLRRDGDHYRIYRMLEDFQLN